MNHLDGSRLLVRAFDSMHAMRSCTRSDLHRFRCAAALDSMRVCIGSEVCIDSDVVGEIESHLTRGVDIFWIYSRRDVSW